MKQRIWNASTTPSSDRLVGHYLSISKTGTVNFSVGLAATLGFPKNGVQFIQDEERPEDWFVQSSNDVSAFKAREKKMNESQKTKTYMVQNATLARAILKGCNSEDNGKVMVAPEVTKEKGASIGFAIITKSSKTKRGGGKLSGALK